MIFKELSIQCGLYSRNIKFTQKFNLVHSNKNSCGKTSLLRLLLYSMGYAIPSTQGFNFDKCEVTLLANIEQCGDVCFIRYGGKNLKISIQGKTEHYTVPLQLREIQTKLLQISNENILDNILGAFYTDQEKGWTLLNRGVVIGRNRFNIEDLIRGLGGVDCIELINQIKRTEEKIKKCLLMQEMAQYQEQNLKDKTEVDIPPTLDLWLAKKNTHQIKINLLQSENRRIESVLKNNISLKKYIAEMKLQVQLEDGCVVPITTENIMGLNDSIIFLKSKQKVIEDQLNVENKELAEVEQKISERIDFIEDKDQYFDRIFDKKMQYLPLSENFIKQELNQLKKLKKVQETELKEKTKKCRDVDYLHKLVMKYLDMLEIENKSSKSIKYLFTNNLKSMSGAVLHKTVFAFRMAYIKVIENHLNIKLPIILDSPGSKEFDSHNVQLMINLLKQEFTENQIIVASIDEISVRDKKNIEIEGKLLSMGGETS